MSYRDELEAARARIASLREALESAGVAERAKAAAEGAEARAKSATQQLERVRSEPTPGTPSLTEHNRRVPAFTRDGVGAGVVCPLCLALDDRVEMVSAGIRNFVGLEIDSGGLSMSTLSDCFDGGDVICPRCFYVAFKIDQS